MAAQTSTHATLLARLQVGDDSLAWGEFIRRYGALIRSVAQRHGLQSADTDDVLQDVLLALSGAMQSFEYDPARARFRTFLQRIVQRKIFSRFRQKSRAGTIISTEYVEIPESKSDEIWESEWRQHHMRLAMESVEVEFNDRDRKAFAMYVGAGLSAPETAAKLGLRVDQVYQAKSRILKRLSVVIAEQVAEEG